MRFDGVRDSDDKKLQKIVPVIPDLKIDSPLR